MAYNRPDPQVHHWLIPHKLLQCGLDSIFIRVSQLSAIFFMQLKGFPGDQLLQAISKFGFACNKDTGHKVF
jgi:hypothetical protein